MAADKVFRQLAYLQDSSARNVFRISPDSDRRIVSLSCGDTGGSVEVFVTSLRQLNPFDPDGPSIRPRCRENSNFTVSSFIIVMKLLVIEDEKDLSDSICTYLGKEQFICEKAYDYRGAVEKIQLNEYACIILDIMLPFGSGMDLLRKVREEGKTDGILIVSARNSVEDKIKGLQIGADDYLAKPFHLSELAARVHAIIRRKMHGGNNIVSFNEISIDTLAKQVAIRNEPVELTRKEYELLLYFISNQRRVISKNALVDHLWHHEMGTGDSLDFIYTHIKNLRKKLQEKGCGDYLKSLYGMGYKLTDQ